MSSILELCNDEELMLKKLQVDERQLERVVKASSSSVATSHENSIAEAIFTQELRLFQQHQQHLQTIILTQQNQLQLLLAKKELLQKQCLELQKKTQEVSDQIQQCKEHSLTIAKWDALAAQLHAMPTEQTLKQQLQALDMDLQSLAMEKAKEDALLQKKKEHFDFLLESMDKSILWTRQQL